MQQVAEHPFHKGPEQLGFAMSRSTLFSFSDQLGGYFISNGNTIFAKCVPATLIAAINEAKLYDIKCISIAPNGGWIACYHETAEPAGGPHGDNYFGEQVPKPLETYLEAHANEDRCNPLHWVTMGPQDQWFARRFSTMDWQLMPPVEAAMLKLQKLGVQRKLEELVFGPDNTAIFIFSDGSFMWDLPLISEEHRVLQQHYAKGTHLEAAALCLSEPGDYFFLWGDACASFKMPNSEYTRITGMVDSCNSTRMQLLTSHRTLVGSAAHQDAKHSLSPQSISRNHTTYKENDIYYADNSCNEPVLDKVNSNAPASHETQTVLQLCPRYGSGNLRLWPVAKLVPGVASLLSNEH